eukprot:NODE_6207_length_560_cov_23.658199_g6042_i0.p1 GENE.NODE_6207_length_560_cov_23.658199_g6042_i0~~NODE_6207_length_560_cov_23.658199_g6042_i0.p1  ORF type:complete len:153 (-),score=31.73 NODE_6207_length_560_cov_23.658199_g6042_i0:23-481(-)
MHRSMLETVSLCAHSLHCSAAAVELLHRSFQSSSNFETARLLGNLKTCLCAIRATALQFDMAAHEFKELNGLSQSDSLTFISTYLDARGATGTGPRPALGCTNCQALHGHLHKVQERYTHCKSELGKLALELHSAFDGQRRTASAPSSLMTG